MKTTPIISTLIDFDAFSPTPAIRRGFSLHRGVNKQVAHWLINHRVSPEFVSFPEIFLLPIQGMKKAPYIAFVIATCLVSGAISRPAFAQSGNDILDAKVKATSLCTTAEQVMFTCRIGGRSLSICLAGTESKQPQLSYRFGVKGKAADMEIPAASTSARPNLFAAYPTVPGGNGRHVRLGAKHGDVEYVVYLNEYKFDLPVQGAGVVVLKNGVQQAVLACTSINYTDQGFWALDTRPDLATPTPFPESSNDELVSLPDIAWTPCGELNKRDWNRYCGAATEAF